MADVKRIRKLPYLIAFAVIIGIAFFVLRGPHISNVLKKLILPELEMVSGRNIIAKKIYLNLFPLFIEAKGLKVFDEDGRRVLFAKRVKAYFDISGLLSRDAVIRRLVIKEPEITADREQISEITENIRRNIAKKRGGSFRVTIRVVEVQDGGAIYSDSKTASVTDITGFNCEVIIGRTRRIKANVDNISFKKAGWPEFSGKAAVGLTVTDGNVRINMLDISSSGSEIKSSGEYREDRWEFKTDVQLPAMTVKKIFNLKSSGEGMIRAEGNVSYAGSEISVDMDLTGKFYLQTLMELLRVKQKVEGLVDVKGKIKGPLRDITGHGRATMRQGNLFNVEIDSMDCDISYADGKMKFINADGKLYNGSATASAYIRLPKVTSYSLDIDFTGIDSIPLFGLIRWNPGVPEGKVNGKLSTLGAKFNPDGWFEYKNTASGENVLGRVKKMTGKFAKQGPVLTLDEIRVDTERSWMDFSGSLDLKKKIIDLKGNVRTDDVTDLSGPYYENLRGKGEFAGGIKGDFHDPVITGNIKIYDPVIEDYAAAMLDADITYSKDLLEIRDLTLKGGVELHKLAGDIYFRKATRLFDFSGPEFSLNVSLGNANLEDFVGIYNPEFAGSGRVRADMRIEGTAVNPAVEGAASILNAEIYGQPFDFVSFDFRFADRKLEFQKMVVRRGRSLLKADAVIDTSGNFSYNAISDKVFLGDLIRRRVPLDLAFSLKSEGGGRFDNPSISLDAMMIGSTYEGRHIRAGAITASIEDKKLTVNAGLDDKYINITAEARLEEEFPWDAKIEIRPGSYEFLLAPFLKDAPEDFTLSLNGTTSLHGDRNHIYGSSEIEQVMISMYGYSFSSEGNISLDFNDRRITLNKITMQSGKTSLSISGSLEIGEQYDLVLEGSSALSPFKSLSDKLSLLKGDAEFVFSITGDWDEPEINGGLGLSNGSFGLKDYYYRISSLEGYLYIDRDRVVLHKLVGKVGGGDVEISGLVYLKKFSFKRFYVESELDNITALVSPDFKINFGGNILLKGAPDSLMILGDFKINRAWYKERVEWKSWLLKTRKTEKYRTDISGIEKARLNIKVTGKDNIFIDNNIARATVSTDLLLKGTVYRPVLFGRLESKDGTVYFRNNEFRILHASADFSDPHRINPIITISSETIVKGYKIKMNLEGQLDHFNMSLSSDPPLEEMDILALLTLGQKGVELKGLEGGIGAGEATSFVTGKLQDVIEERLKTVTGLDRLQFDPYVSKSSGAVEPRVTVSKRMLGEKIFITYTTTLGSTEEQIIKLEYFMNKNISVVGIRDERGILGGDIRFRFEFK